MAYNVTESQRSYNIQRRRPKNLSVGSSLAAMSVRLGSRWINFKGYFNTRIVGEVSPDEIREYLDKPLGRSKAVPTLKTWNNRRGYLSTFFKYCLSKKYVAENPILEVPKFKVKKARGTADTLSAQEAKEFMAWLETYQGPQNKDGTYWGKPSCMVPYYALTLFAGIPPDWKDGEIKKLKAKDFRFETDVILIEPEASKVNEKRTVKIHPNLKQWLEKYPIEEFPIIPPRRFRDLWVDVRKLRSALAVGQVLMPKVLHVEFAFGGDQSTRTLRADALTFSTLLN